MAPFNPISPIVNFYIAWKEGEAHKHYRWDTKTMYKTVKRSLRNLDYEVLKDQDTNNGYYIVAGANDKFKIKIVGIESEITKISIRINFMGDKPYAELIYKEIDEQINIIEYTKRRKLFQRI